MDLNQAKVIVSYLVSTQHKTVDEAIEEVCSSANLPYKEALCQIFAPPLNILPSDFFVGNDSSIPRCNPQKTFLYSYYESFRDYLANQKGWSNESISNLNETSLKLISRLPDPGVTKSFSEKGLVVGHIQSGKTTNMSALICRAADHGYRLFIILAGFWKDLRAQTQRRMDQEVAGSSNDLSDAPLVEHDRELQRWVRLTSSGMDGDFQPGPSDLNPNTLKIAVIKKNNRIDALIKWLQQSQEQLENFPALIIDDEADHGSIDTNYSKKDGDGNPINPTATNSRIRNLIEILPKNVYIGFTATPFANVLIDAELEGSLYPKDFIAILPEPVGYFGPKKLFGLGMTPSNLSSSPAGRPEMDLIKTVDEESIRELKSLVEYGVPECPRILSDALLTFVLSCCGRLARGHNGDKDHFCMLVHTSQRIDPHKAIAETIKEELESIKNATLLPGLHPALLKKAREIWENDFIRVTASLNEKDLLIYDFDSVWKHAGGLIDSMEVKILNNDSEDELLFKGRPKRYIVVGGNRLSRGLTLEGLSVSLFTRNSNQYDTLLQMGRWFGYRPGYYDLTRIFVPDKLRQNFQDLARLEEELRSDLSKYSKEPNPLTPTDLKPIIRSHPSMRITSKFKMGAAKVIIKSFDSPTQQTINFPVDSLFSLRKNLTLTKSFISQLKDLPDSESDLGMHIWKDLPSSMIVDYLNEYEFSPEAREVNRFNLINYITRLNDAGEILLWDVVLPHGNKERGTFEWTSDIITNKIFRSPDTMSSISTLRSPGDEEKWIKLAGRNRNDMARGCIMFYVVDKTCVSDSGLKLFANPEDAEDLLGFVIFFPQTKTNVSNAEYVSQ